MNALFPLKFVIGYIQNKAYPSLYSLQIELTSRCNLNCKMCCAKRMAKQIWGLQDLSYAQIISVISQAKKMGLHHLTLGALGEPTLHKNFAEIVNFAKKNKLYLSMATNLTTNDKIKLEAINKIDDLAISIDATTAKTYKTIRGYNLFDQVIKNLEWLAENKRKKQKFQWNCVIQKDNYAEICDIIKLASDLKFDHVSLGFPNTPLDSVAKKVKLSEKELDEYILLAREARRLSRELQIDVFGIEEQFLMNKNHLLRSHFCGGENYNLPCYKLWLGCYVGANGEVYPCCSLAASNPEIKFGNIYESQFETIWTSDRFNKIRLLFKSHRPEACKGCPVSETNRKIQRFMHPCNHF